DHRITGDVPSLYAAAIPGYVWIAEFNEFECEIAWVPPLGVPRKRYQAPRRLAVQLPIQPVLQALARFIIQRTVNVGPRYADRAGNVDVEARGAIGGKQERRFVRTVRGGIDQSLQFGCADERNPRGAKGGGGKQFVRPQSFICWQPRICVLANVIAQTREGKACKLVIPLLRGGRKRGRVVAQRVQCLPRAQLDVFPQLATRIFKFSGVRVADGEVAVERGVPSRGLLLGRLQPFDGFIAPAHPDQRHTEPIVHGEPRPITAIEPDRISEKTYCFSRSPGFAQSKCKLYAIRYRVRVSL